MVTSIKDDMFTGEAIADPYSYYGKIRDEDPVYWNELYELWVVTKPPRPRMDDAPPRAFFVGILAA